MGVGSIGRQYSTHERKSKIQFLAASVAESNKMPTKYHNVTVIMFKRPLDRYMDRIGLKGIGTSSGRRD